MDIAAGFLSVLLASSLGAIAYKKYSIINKDEDDDSLVELFSELEEEEEAHLLAFDDSGNYYYVYK